MTSRKDDTPKAFDSVFVKFSDKCRNCGCRQKAVLPNVYFADSVAESDRDDCLSGHIIEKPYVSTNNKCLPFVLIWLKSIEDRLYKTFEIVWLLENFDFLS